jgi:hypothetical protein
MREVVALERRTRDLPKSSEAARNYWDTLMRQAAQRGAEPDHHMTPIRRPVGRGGERQ